MISPAASSDYLLNAIDAEYAGYPKSLLWSDSEVWPICSCTHIITPAVRFPATASFHRYCVVKIPGYENRIRCCPAGSVRQIGLGIQFPWSDAVLCPRQRPAVLQAPFPRSSINFFAMAGFFYHHITSLLPRTRRLYHP